MYHAELENGTTRFHCLVPHDTDTLMAIELRTVNPPPPLDDLLADLGLLRVSTVLSIPGSLVCALGIVDYVDTRLTICCDFGMFFSGLNKRLRVTFHTLSSNYVTGVQFMVRRVRDPELEPEPAPIQQIAHQTVQSLEPTRHFAFSYTLDRLTKGFFIEGTLHDISSVILTASNGQDLWNYYATELSVLGRNIGEKYLFVPFNDRAIMRSTTAESYDGGFASRDPIQLTVTYHRLRLWASSHVLQCHNIRSTIRILNPERNMCPISYETITGDFCECDQCHHAFAAAAFQTYVYTRLGLALTCPICRSSWSNQDIYSQPASV